MAGDDAPAATIGGYNGKGKVTAQKSIQRQAPARFSKVRGPTSLVAAEIHLGHSQRASAMAGCAAIFKLRAMHPCRTYRDNSNSYGGMLEP
jgi:hypothetical protein